MTTAENKAACGPCMSEIRSTALTSDHESHEGGERTQITIPLLRFFFVKLLRKFIISRSNPRCMPLDTPAGFRVTSRAHSSPTTYFNRKYNCLHHMGLFTRGVSA